MKNNLLKFIALFISILLCSFTLSSCKSPAPPQDLLKVVKSRDKIIAGVKYDAKPFGFVDKDQQIKGYDVDVVKEVAKRVLGHENAAEFQQVTSSNRIFSLTSGSIDMIAATMTITPKRSQIIDFSAPYFAAGQAIMVRKNSKINSAKDLNNKRVIVVLGSTSEQNLRLMAPYAHIIGFRTYTDAYSALRSGRGDAFTTDDAILYGFLAKDKKFKILTQRYSKEPYGIGFRKAPETKEFQKEVNNALKNMMLDGTIGKLRRKWTIYHIDKSEQNAINDQNGINDPSNKNDPNSINDQNNTDNDTNNASS